MKACVDGKMIRRLGKRVENKKVLLPLVYQPLPNSSQAALPRSGQSEQSTASLQTGGSQTQNSAED